MAAIDAGLKERSEGLRKDDGQNVRTFVSDHWTLEYVLARSGLGAMVFHAALFANAHDKICDGAATQANIHAKAEKDFAQLLASCDNDDELIAIHVYQLLTSKKASKAIAAQYLAAAIDTKVASEGFDPAAFEACLPTYLVDAIKHACGYKVAPDPPDGAQPGADATAQ